MKKIIKAFTLVELIVSIMIVAILATIWFYSYIWYLTEARDSQRKANIWEILTSLKIYKQKRWAYPIPWNNFNITNSWIIIAIQWKLDENVTLSTMEKIPKDPFTEKRYSYSISKNKQESQISLTLENWEFPIAILEWDYKTVSKDIVPSIMVATWWITTIEIHTWILNWSNNRHLFILDWWENLPYSISSPYKPFYGWKNIDDVLVNWNINFWQNSDYRTCAEIELAAKLIHEVWTEDYQILHDNWYLISTWCTLP